MLIQNGGVFVLYTDSSTIDDVYQDQGGVVESLIQSLLSNEELAAMNLPPNPTGWEKFPHANLVLKAFTPNKASVLVKVSPGCEEFETLTDYRKNSVYGLKARNKEQNMLLNALMDPEVLCVAVEGKAGSGKTICTLAAALELLKRKDNPYERVVLSRPMSSVGSPMGALPGDATEKFLPYAGNFLSNFEALMGGKRGLDYMMMMVQKGQLEFKPLKLIGGISWHNTIVLADEIQSLSPEQMYALVTRPAEGSKLVLLGDSAQRYGKRSAVEETGLYQWSNSRLVHESNLASHIKLIKQERSGLAELGYRVFVEDE